MIFYESPHRLEKTLEQLAEVFGAERQACVSRELTKVHEENIRGSLFELLEYYKTHPLKGEIVLIVAGRPEIKETREEKQERKKADWDRKRE
jgi:16S rRNA (cytidine1402-2'-O)-methyltransferase